MKLKKKKAFTEQYSNFSDFGEKTAYVQKCQMQIKKIITVMEKKKKFTILQVVFRQCHITKK